MQDFNPIYSTKRPMTDEIKSDLAGSATGDTFDLNMPDMPDLHEEREQVIKDKDAVGFKFGFIGAGQGGGKLAESFHNLGYGRVAAINTADQDLATINIPNKMKFGSAQGAGKNRSIAKEAFLNHKEDVIDLMKRSFGNDIDRVFVTVGAGGGTGAGVCSELVKVAKEYQTSINASSPYVGLILALPKTSEGKKVNENAYETLKEACALVEQKIVSPLIILDNEKINALYPKLPINKFWQVANGNICSLFHLFNNIITKNSEFSTFDTNDFKTVLDSGIMVFGAANVKSFENETDISKAVRDNLRRNVLCGELDLSTGSVAAAVAIADENTLGNIPQEYLDSAFNQLNRLLKTNSTVHQGIYKGTKEGLTIFTAIGGISRPEGKLRALQSLSV
jgi:cell division GTPase FtsZ